MTNSQEILDLLQDVGALITKSHIVYTSGKHGNAYINKDAIYPHTKKISDLCLTTAKHFKGGNIDVIVAPAIGGVILSQWIAHHLSILTNKEVLAIYAEKDADNNFVIKRGYDKFIRDARVLVAEDILTTGGSAKKVIDVARSLGGEIVGLAALCNRGGVMSTDLSNVPEIFSLINIKLESWDEKECPLCKKGIPINIEVGKGREFLAKRNKS